ncbi:MAG: SpoIIE family protein phosphatase [Microscillaceae bacterium]|nr:SpoIIE family protein phosphatase [Microscillaceae bacterium]
MRHRLSIYFCILFCFYISISSSFAQNGDLYLYNYYHTVSNADQRNYASLQDQKGVMYFANTKGIITYNGIDWQINNTLTTPYSLALDTLISNKVYVGCGGSFGYLQEDARGRKKYVAISEANQRFGRISQIVLNYKHAFFYSDQVLYRVSLETQKVEKVWFARPEQSYAGIFTHQEDIYINIKGKGLHRVVENELVPLRNTLLPGDAYIHSYFKFNYKYILVSTYNNQMYLFDGFEYQNYTIESQKYLEENLLSTTLNVSDKLFALGTVSGGCMLIDKKTRKTVRTVNYQTGLPDDEVMAMSLDHFGGLWLCTEYSISRADIHLPIQNFAEYPGLEGKITTITRLHHTLYTATSEGVFFLEKVKNFEELVTVVNQEKEKISEVQTTIEKKIEVTKYVEAPPTLEIPEKLRKKLDKAKKKEEKRDKKKNKKEQIPAQPIENPSLSEEEENIPLPEEINMSSSINKRRLDPQYKSNTTYQYVGKKNERSYALQSIPFVYKKIPGLKAKCVQLLNFQDKILVASNIGLYEIVNNQARAIISDNDIHYIFQSHSTPNRFYIGTAQGLIFLYYEEGQWVVSEKLHELVNYSIYSIAGNDQVLWLGSINQIFKIELNAEGKPIRSKNYKMEHNYSENITVRMIAGRPTFFLSDGIYSYHTQKDRLYQDKSLNRYFNPRAKVLFRQTGYTWTRPQSRWENIHELQKSDRFKSTFLSLFQDIEDIYVDDQQNIWIIDNNALYRVNARASAYQGQTFNIFVKEVRDLQGNLLPLHHLKLDYKNSAFRIELGSPFYLSESATEYQYKIDQLTGKWSAWSNQPSVSFPYLPSGRYTIHFRAKNIFGQLSQEITYTFTIKPPYWETWWFYLGAILLVLLLIIAFLRIRTRTLEAANKKLEQKVNEKTAEIELQKSQLEVAFNEIDKKNKDITGSIRYAKRIQEAILPYSESIYKALDDSFIFYKPKDVVSGDFYWFAEKGYIKIIVAADCTGHGVPGAFMSMIGNSLLNQIVLERHIIEPAQILHDLDMGVVKALKQNDPKSKQSDGMDISICVLDTSTQQIAFAGANNSLFYVQKGQTQVLKADRKGIGGFRKGEKRFTNHYLNIQENTYFYMTSDGFCDQFGGPEQKKFMKNRFRKLLEKVYYKSGVEQKTIFQQTLEDWKGKQRQVDDILVLGFRMEGLKRP